MSALTQGGVEITWRMVQEAKTKSSGTLLRVQSTRGMIMMITDQAEIDSSNSGIWNA